MPIVSVVIPTFNHCNTIGEALTSVFSQTFRDFEVIVVNDGSPDDTRAVLLDDIQQNRIRYWEQQNLGQATARNRGIAMSTGAFIALLDDDDLWPPEKLERQLQLLHSTPSAVMAWGDATFLDSGELVRDNLNSGKDWQGRRVIHRCAITSPGQTLIRTAALKAIGGFDESIWGADDYDMYIRLAGQGAFIYDPHPSLIYRWHETNASRNAERLNASVHAVRKKHVKDVYNRLSDNIQDRQCSTDVYDDRMWLGWHEFVEGDFGLSRRNFRFALKADPKRFIRSGWRQAKAAFIPDRLRPMWNRIKGQQPPAK